MISLCLFLQSGDLRCCGARNEAPGKKKKTAGNGEILSPSARHHCAQAQHLQATQHPGELQGTERSCMSMGKASLQTRPSLRAAERRILSFARG